MIVHKMFYANGRIVRCRLLFLLLLYAVVQLFCTLFFDAILLSSDNACLVGILLHYHDFFHDFSEVVCHTGLACHSCF
jgi:hypothetical protein